MIGLREGTRMATSSFLAHVWNQNKTLNFKYVNELAKLSLALSLNSIIKPKLSTDLFITVIYEPTNNLNDCNAVVLLQLTMTNLKQDGFSFNSLDVSMRCLLS